MGKKQGKGRGGLVELDPEKLKSQLVRLGLSKSGLSEKAGISRNTVLSAFRGEGIFPKSALCIAEALGCDDPSELMLPGSTEVTGSQVGGEWQVKEYLSNWLEASNGLRHRVSRLRHEFVDERLGRGKCYDLEPLKTRSREDLRTHLIRHPRVCERIGHHDHIAFNLSTLPGRSENSWWVIDRWVGGTTLEDRLRHEPLPAARLATLMHEIAVGLSAMHAAGVVFRELAPSRVLLASEDQRAVLTDFELAKLLDAVPTVSTNWPDDPFRAPEVENGTASEQSDLYSWARVLLQAATGKQLPPKGQDNDALNRVGLPKAVWRVATDCLAPGPSDRPKNVKQVLQATGRWVAM